MPQTECAAGCSIGSLPPRRSQGGSDVRSRSELFEQLEQRNEEIKDLIGGVPGFVSYTAFRSSEGGATVTVCQDKTGTDESSRRAAEWVKENISTMANPPMITEGGTVAHFSS